MKQTEEVVRYVAIQFDEEKEGIRVGFYYSSYYEILKESPERTRSYGVINTPHITIHSRQYNFFLVKTWKES